MKKFNITWTAPANDGGSAITGHDVGYTPSGGSETVVATGSTAAVYTLSGLTDDVEYSVRVRAENSAGKGAWSDAVVQVAALPPAQTTGLAVDSTGDGTIDLSWSAPASDAAITDYRVEYTPSGGSATEVLVGSAATSYQLTGLTNDTEYSVRVAAVSAAGAGAYSAAVTGTPGAGPLPGPLYAWGLNGFGQYGAGFIWGPYYQSPNLVGSEQWLHVDAGNEHSIGIKQNGTLYGWGRNEIGTYNGTTDYRTTPVQIGTDTWISAAAAESVNHAIKSDGTLWGWGHRRSSYNLVGDGSTVEAFVASPKQIGVGHTWKYVNSSLVTAHAITTQGELYGWGYNADGSVGDGTTTNRHSPVQVGSDSDWVTVSTGSAHSAGIKADGSLYAWGLNWAGQLGDGSNTSTTLPIKIGVDSWLMVSTGLNHTIGIKADGTLWAFGLGEKGQLGNGSTNSSSFPQQVGSDTWIWVKAASNNSFGIKSDGTLWSWGENNNGALGVGGSGNRTSPTQVGSGLWLRIYGGNIHTFGISSV